MNVNKVINENN